MTNRLHAILKTVFILNLVRSIEDPKTPQLVKFHNSFLLIPRLFAPLLRHSIRLRASSQRSLPLTDAHSSISSFIVVIALPSLLNFASTNVFNESTDILSSFICNPENVTGLLFHFAIWIW